MVSTPTCFGTRVPSSGGLLQQRNTSPTCQSRYWLPSLSSSKSYSIKIPEYLKLTHWNPLCCDTEAKWYSASSKYKLTAVYIWSGALIQTSISMYVIQMDHIHRGRCCMTVACTFCHDHKALCVDCGKVEIRLLLYSPECTLANPLNALK